MARRQAPLLRRCVTCRGWASKLELIRVIRSPEGEVRLDTGGKLAGRGAYLHRTQACLEGALRKHHLERALRRSLPVETATAISALVSGAPIGPRVPDTSSEGTAQLPGARHNDGLDNRSLNG